MPAEVDQRIVAAFWSYMMKEFGADRINKKDSDMMQLVASFLDGLGVADKDAFMNHFTTTVGYHIYTPFELGEANSDYALWNQMSVCVHECEHVRQFNDDPARFVVEYLTRRSARAHYEAEAFRCSMEMHHWRYGVVPNLARYTSALKSYDLDQLDRDYVMAFLEASAKTVLSGGVIGKATQKAIAWLEDHAPELKAGAA